MDTKELRNVLAELTSPGLLGRFEYIELVEIIANAPASPSRNLLSVAVLIESIPAGQLLATRKFLTKRLKVEGMKGWSFGVVRTFLPLSALNDALVELDRSGRWNIVGEGLATGRLSPMPGVFVPPDGTATVPINKILKNNFWAGSHVLRLHDGEKTEFLPFVEDGRRLQNLSDAIGDAVPIAFAGLVDVLGDIVIQIPVKALVLRIGPSADDKRSSVQVHWRADTPPRELTISGRNRTDNVLTSASFVESFALSAKLSVNPHQHAVETEIWDRMTGILVGATAATSTLKSATVNMIERLHEPRVFNQLDVSGVSVPARIALERTRRSVVGSGERPDAWLARRNDIEEKRRLAQTRAFVQYLPVPGANDEHVRALTDIRFLIEHHGVGGVDLWDPYLSGRDILATLFHCLEAGSPLRALTDGRDPPIKRSGSDDAGPMLGPIWPFVPRERWVLNQYAGNREGLNLEYRTRGGGAGWAFHDRFLIFPNGENGPLAWSLGTSINSLGKAHHILQKVSNPVLVAGAFEDLWRAVQSPANLIWKAP